MKLLLLLIIFLTTILNSNIALATGNDLLKDCNNYSVAKGTWGQGYCLGLVIGVAQTSSKICPPKGVTNKQMVLVFERYLKNTPEMLHYSASLLAEHALSQVWPCRNK